MAYMKKVAAVVGIITAVVLLFVITRRATAPSHLNEPVKTTPPVAEQTFNKNLYPIDQPDSLWMVVNKERALPSSYIPADLKSANGGQLRSNAADALARLITAAKSAGVNLKVISSYRSYATQDKVYGGYVAADGQANADTYSARPGHSEHQTGLAVDMGDENGSCDLEICFGDSNAGKWLAIHASEYGFIIRYPDGKSHITGYQYEPWHLRFVGSELASQLRRTGQTLEEFFGIVPAKQPY